MTDHLCVICASADPVGGWTVCQRCAAKLDDDLCAIVTLTRAAADHLTPATKPSAGGSGKPGSRPPLDVGALDDAMAADALPLCESWERLAREHFGYSPYGPASLLRLRRPSDPRDTMGSKRPGDASTSRGLDNAYEER